MAAARSGMSKIFDPESKKQKVLFTQKQENEPRPGGGRISTNTFTDLDGSVAAVERIEYAKDGENEKFVSYKVTQKQLLEIYNIKKNDLNATTPEAGVKVIAVDASGRIKGANAKSAELTQRSTAALVGD